MATATCTVGLDFGTGSARAIAVDTSTGDELATSVYEYPHGVIEDAQDPNLARQDPSDYAAALEATLTGVASEVAQAGHRVVGIGAAPTGSTPLPVDADGVPLGLHEQWTGEPAAKAWLWKDHTSFAEAAEITETFHARGLPYLDYIGGTYSSEWFWAKILRCARTAPDVFAAAHTWLELADLIPAIATGTGTAVRRNACAAGHKALFAERWGGLPEVPALAALHPGLADLRGRLYDRVWPADSPAGGIDPGLAARTGLAAEDVVAVGVRGGGRLDNHVSGHWPGLLRTEQ